MTTPTINIDVFEYLAREAKARLANTTPGPWIREWAQDGETLPDGTGYAGDYYPTKTVIGDAAHAVCEQEVADCRRGEDAEFIASARQDVDALSDAVLALVDEVRRLTEERDELLEQAEDRTSKMCECMRILPYATAICGECGFRFTQPDEELRPVVSHAQYASFVTEADRAASQSAADAEAFSEALGKCAKTLEQRSGSADYDYILDPATPMEVIDADLRAAGLDPEKVAREGTEFVQKLMRAKEAASMRRREEKE